MERRRIGTLEVSLIGLGCNNFGWRVDEAGTAKVVNAALESGINFFDTADGYGGTRSEEFLGRVLGGRRKDVVLATKFGMRIDEKRQGASAPYVRQAVEDSLRRLGTDCIDLYQLHVPDPNVPIEETLSALAELVRAGKVREIGCSNFSTDQLKAARAAIRPGAARFVSVQNHYSLLHREPEAGVLAECDRQGVGFLPYFPLASGMLTGKHRRGQPAAGSRLAAGGGFFAKLITDANFAKVEALQEFATSRGHSLLELAISWLAVNPTVSSVIAGATSVEQVKANASAAGWHLTAAELKEIDRIAPRSN